MKLILWVLLLVLVSSCAGKIESNIPRLGAANTDQNVFTMNLNGSIEVIKAQDNNSNDKLILGNLGEVNPTLKSDRVRFLLKLDSDLNREVTQSEVLGYVQQKGTELVVDNCLL